MTLTLADRSVSYPFGVNENVLVQVNELVFPLTMRLAFMTEAPRWRVAAMVESLGTGSRPLKGTLSSTGRPIK